MGIYCCLLDLKTNRYQSRILLIEQVWSANPKASGFQGADWYCQVGLCESIQNSWITEDGAPTGMIFLKRATSNSYPQRRRVFSEDMSQVAIAWANKRRYTSGCTLGREREKIFEKKAASSW